MTREILFCSFVMVAASCSAKREPSPTVKVPPAAQASRHGRPDIPPGGTLGQLAPSDDTDSFIEPLLGVRVIAVGGRPVFSANFKCDAEAPAVVDHVAITDPSDLGSIAVYCLLRADTEPKDLRFPAGGWEYGSSLSGYRLEGACAPLKVGQKYAVTMSGIGGGGAVFEIQKDGTARVLEDDCRASR